MISLSHMSLGSRNEQSQDKISTDPKWDEPIDVYAPGVNEPERTRDRAFSSP